MTFKTYLANSAEEINEELDLFFSKWVKEVRGISPRLYLLADAFYDACKGGKRIRGSLVRLGFNLEEKRSLHSGRDDKDIIKIAAAYEIFQAAILAHDDVIDKSLLRRGKPSLYAKLGGDHGGVSKAICLGDIGFFLAFKIISESGFEESRKNRAIQIFSKMMLETGLGELLDVVLPEKEDASVNDILTIYKFKTAYYTISAPLMMGAVLGGADEKSLKVLNVFGMNLGIAFQIRDDIRDLFSERDELGKDPGGDILEGKQTLLSNFLFERGNKEQLSVIKKYFGRSGKLDIGEVRKVFDESGARGFAEKEAREYADKAERIVVEISENEETRNIFYDMVNSFVK